MMLLNYWCVLETLLVLSCLNAIRIQGFLLAIVSVWETGTWRMGYGKSVFFTEKVQSRDKVDLNEKGQTRYCKIELKNSCSENLQKLKDIYWGRNMWNKNHLKKLHIACKIGKNWKQQRFPTCCRQHLLTVQLEISRAGRLGFFINLPSPRPLFLSAK